MLIVEDNPDVREITEAFCQQLGFAISSVSSATDALALLAGDTAIDVLFADVMMPGMTGDRLATAAKLLRPSLKVLLATGHPDFAGDSDAAVILKPYRFGVLQQRLAELLDGGGAAPGGSASETPA